MQVTIEQNKTVDLEDCNLYEVKINGKLQGRFTFNKINKTFQIPDDAKKEVFASAEDAARECIKRNGRNIPKDVKIKNRR